jgi:hypothetical protein
MAGVPPRHQSLRRVTTVAFVLDLIGAAGAIGYGVFELAVHRNGPAGLGFLAAGVAGLIFGTLAYCHVLLIYRFVNYAYRAYDTLLDAADLLRRQEEHTRTIAENSALSEWTKRVVYREKDYEFLRDTIHAAIIRQDWEAAEHLIRDVDAEFGYHDEAGHLREELNQARRATTEERVTAAVARVEALCNQQKWEQARGVCERLRTLFPEDARIGALPHEIELRRQEFKRKLLAEYDQAVRSKDLERAHRLLFALDQHLIPKEAEALKPSARNVFRARLEQIKTQFSIAVSYRQFSAAIEAGERLIREFPNSGYAQEISKLLPILRQRATQQTTADVISTSASPPS